MSRPRVLQVGKYYPPFIGGVERALRDAAEGTAGEFDVRVLACNHQQGFVRERCGPVEVFRAARPFAAFSMPISLQFFSLFRNLAREADLLHFHHPFPLADMAALLDGCAGRKVVISYHSDVVRQKWAMPVYKKVQRRFLQLADRILISSQRMQVHSPFLREFQPKCRVVPYGVRFDDSPGAEFPLPAKDFVLFVGRLVPYKGVEFLIRAMGSVDAPLILAGDGPLRADLERLAREEGVAEKVHFLGRLSGGRLRHCFRSCRLFVLPSVMSNEAFGIVQLEAMAFGKPVVNTDLPTSVPEVSLHEETGLTVPPGNPVALAEAIRTILADSKRCERYGRAAAARARGFSMERYVEGVRGVYRELLGEDGPA